MLIIKHVFGSEKLEYRTYLEHRIKSLMRKKLLYIHMLTHVHIHIIYTCVCIYVWCESCSVVSDSLWSHGLYSPWNSPSQNTVAGSLSLLQGIFPRQGSNPGLPHCRQILLPAEPQGKAVCVCVCVCVCGLQQKWEDKQGEKSIIY